MINFIVIASIILWFVGLIWLGIRIEHPFITFIVGILINIIAFIINKTLGIIIFLTGPGVLLIILMILLFSIRKENFRDKKRQKETKRLNDEFNYAIQNHDLERIQTLFTVVTDEKKKSTLVSMVESDEKEITELLLGTDIDTKFFHQGKTLFEFAKNEDMINILKRHGVKTKEELKEEFNSEGLKHYEEAEKSNDAEEFRKALAEWKKVEKQDNPEILLHLGELYAFGKGVIQNLKVAFDYWYKASELGNYFAQIRLGVVSNWEKEKTQIFVDHEKWEEIFRKYMEFVADCYINNTIPFDFSKFKSSIIIARKIFVELLADDLDPQNEQYFIRAQEIIDNFGDKYGFDGSWKLETLKNLGVAMIEYDNAIISENYSKTLCWGSDFQVHEAFLEGR